MASPHFLEFDTGVWAQSRNPRIFKLVRIVQTSFRLARTIYELVCRFLLTMGSQHSRGLNNNHPQNIMHIENYEEWLPYRRKSNSPSIIITTSVYLNYRKNTRTNLNQTLKLNSGKPLFFSLRISRFIENEQNFTFLTSPLFEWESALCLQ